MKLPYAEDVNYWKTGKSSPDTWLEKSADLIKNIGGEIITYAFGQDPSTGNQAYLFVFELAGDRYKIVWPVLPTRSSKDLLSAKRQAATLMFHDIKNKCLNSVVKGKRRTFFEYLMLPDGRTAPDASYRELSAGIPALFAQAEVKLIK